MAKRKTVNVDQLRKYSEEVLVQNGLSRDEAEITVDVLITADQRGIESHGVARLKRYVRGLNDGTIVSDADREVVKETPVSMVVDGNGGMGQPITYKTMKNCIEKAKNNFMSFASIKNSNHYGIAGYYTLMALEEDLIGISSTNSFPLVLPTFAKNASIGTNPISVGVPAKNKKPFLLDMATSTVPRGKLEVYSRAEKKIPENWATDKDGKPATDPDKVLDNLVNKRGGGLLPFGGSGEESGGHKGYGLSALVDIFSGILSGGTVGKDVYGKENQPPEVCHFIGAINPEAFAGKEAIEDKMDYYIDMLKDNDKVEGHNKIYVAGEKEYNAMAENEDTLDIQAKVFEQLNELGDPYSIELKEH